MRNVEFCQGMKIGNLNLFDANLVFYEIQTDLRVHFLTVEYIFKQLNTFLNNGIVGPFFTEDWILQQQTLSYC